MKPLLYILLTVFTLLLVLALIATWLMTGEGTAANLAGWASEFQQRMNQLPDRQATPQSPLLPILYGVGLLVGVGVFIAVIKELGKRFQTNKEVSE